MSTKNGDGKVFNVNVTFHVLVKANDPERLKELLFDETEWLGEPRSRGGCVIAMKPKKMEVIK